MGRAPLSRKVVNELKDYLNNPPKSSKPEINPELYREVVAVIEEKVGLKPLSKSASKSYIRLVFSKAISYANEKEIGAELLKRDILSTYCNEIVGSKRKFVLRVFSTDKKKIYL